MDLLKCGPPQRLGLSEPDGSCLMILMFLRVKSYTFVRVFLSEFLYGPENTAFGKRGDECGTSVLGPSGIGLGVVLGGANASYR